MLLLVACAIALGMWAMQAERNRPGVTWENIAKIEIGMSEGEVEFLMGGPGEKVRNREGARSWQNEDPMEGIVLVLFGRDGTVRNLRWNPPPDAFLPRWRRWLFGG
jgi:outer membrane protein assembly factor BamE (lipoprotein component of BamABCDE complex)